MKTFVAVLCALVATAGVALAHGTGGGGVGGGGPVMSPVSMPVFQPVTMPVGGGSSTSNNFPVYSPSRPAPLAQDNHRRIKPPVPLTGSGPAFVWDPRICRPPQWLFTPSGVIELSGAYTCGLDDSFVAQNYGPIPKWLPPAFLW